MSNEPVFVVQQHPIVDLGPAEYEGPATQGVVVAALAVEPIAYVEETHPVIDGGPAEWEPANPPGVVLAAPPAAEPLPEHVQQHRLVDPGPALVE